MDDDRVRQHEVPYDSSNPKRTDTSHEIQRVSFTHLCLHSGGALGRQLVPEHVHLGRRGLRLMRLLVQLLAQQLHFVLYAERGQRHSVRPFRRVGHRRAVHVAAVLRTKHDTTR